MHASRKYTDSCTLFAAYHRTQRTFLTNLHKGELKVRNVFQELNVKIITEKDFAA